jgi:hypothetical protein
VPLKVSPKRFVRPIALLLLRLLHSHLTSIDLRPVRAGRPNASAAPPATPSELPLPKEATRSVAVAGRVYMKMNLGAAGRDSESVGQGGSGKTEVCKRDRRERIWLRAAEWSGPSLDFVRRSVSECEPLSMLRGAEGGWTY